MLYQNDTQEPPLPTTGNTTTSSPTDVNSNLDKPPDPDFSHAFHYTLRGYDPNAPHFDGLAGVRNEDFLIDLDTDSMER
jgi:hypothetical protein